MPKISYQAAPLFVFFFWRGQAGSEGARTHKFQTNKAAAFQGGLCIARPTAAGMLARQLVSLTLRIPRQNVLSVPSHVCAKRVLPSTKPGEAETLFLSNSASFTYRKRKGVNTSRQATVLFRSKILLPYFVDRQDLPSHPQLNENSHFYFRAI